MQRRYGRPPLDSILSWEDLKGFEGTEDVWPQTVDFAKARSQRLGTRNVDEPVFGVDHMYRVALDSEAQERRFLW